MKNKIELLDQIKSVLEDTANQSFMLFCHQHPDGDVLGAALALKFLLEKKYNKSVTIMSKDNVPDKFDFLEQVSDINTSSDLSNVDVSIILECANLSRTGYLAAEISAKSKKIINIDHHNTNDFYADINWVDSKSAAVCMMVYDIFKYLDVSIDKSAAQYLYVGILTDTGRFQYSNMSLEVYDVIKDLVKNGVDVNFVYRQVYGKKSRSYISFMQILFDNLEYLEVLDSYQLAISYIEDEQLKNYKITVDDTDGAVDYLRDIDGIEIACFIKPAGVGIYKLSLRSKEFVAVDEIAKKFGGGGHKYAAGLEIKAETAEAAKMKLLQVLV